MVDGEPNSPTWKFTQYVKGLCYPSWRRALANQGSLDVSVIKEMWRTLQKVHIHTSSCFILAWARR